jgi:hypothetical protein
MYMEIMCGTAMTVVPYEGKFMRGIILTFITAVLVFHDRSS